jgi:cytochrome P450
VSQEHAWTEVLKCPYEFYAGLHADDPIHELPGDDGFMITRHEDVVWAARHPERFTSRRIRYDELDPEAAEIAQAGYPSPPTVVDNDPPEHSKYRDLGFQAFSPKRVQQFEPMIRRLTDELIDGFAERGRVELMGEFCRLLPMAVICEMLGLPRDDAADLTRWADGRTELLQKYVPRERALELQRLEVEFEQYLGREIEARQASPRDDVLSEIANTTPDPAIECELPHRVAMVLMIVSAGTETTAYALGSAIWLLLTHEGLYERVCRDHALIPRLFEETLRNESPSQWSQRRCVIDTELSGTVIPAGSRVLLMFGAGNRDRALFPEPQEFDLDRPNVKRHLGFGAGPHSCVGAPLARLEARIALERLLARLQNLGLEGPVFEPWWVESTVLHGLGELRLRFDPGASVALS